MQELLNYQADRIEAILAAQGLDVRVVGGVVGPRLVVFHLHEVQIILTRPQCVGAWGQRSRGAREQRSLLRQGDKEKGRRGQGKR